MWSPLALALLAAPSADPCLPSSRFILGAVDREVRLEHPARPLRSPSNPPAVDRGVLRLRFVVGCDGRVELGSLLTPDPLDAAQRSAVVAFLRESRFQPAIVAGRPVRQLVERRFAWASRPGSVAVDLVCPPPRDARPLRALHSVADEPDLAPVRPAAGARPVIS